MITLEDLRNDSRTMPAWRQNRFFILVGGAIVISIILVMIALAIYEASGAAQLDASRQIFQKIQSEVGRSKTDAQAYPSSGQLDSAAFDDFNKLFDQHMNNVNKTKAFNPDTMTDEALGLPTVTNP